MPQTTGSGCVSLCAVNQDRDVELAELLEEVRRIDVLSKRLVTDVMAGRYSSVFRGSGIEFDKVREYVEGDAQRAVDWNVTARMGRPLATWIHINLGLYIRAR